MTNNKQQTAVDAYCPECETYICDERVTFEECCDTCGTHIEYHTKDTEVTNDSSNNIFNSVSYFYQGHRQDTQRNGQMTEKEAIILLIYYNDWRRGEDIEMPNPTQIGIALELIIKEYFKRVPMYFQIVPTTVNQKQIYRLYINQQLHSEHEHYKLALYTQIEIENSILKPGKQTTESGNNGTASKPEPSSGRGH